MKYYLIAGEPSGDLHGGNLMRELLLSDPAAEFRFWGGDLMAAAAGERGTLVRHYKETAVMGVWDVLTHLGKINRNFKECKRDFLAHRPDALILIDYPGFNLPMAKFAKKNGIKVFYYISPKVWASKEYRVKQMRRHIDQIYTIFPFETPFFRRHGIEVNYCGNPVMDALESRPNKNESREEFCRRHKLDPRKPILALLAGSRESEIKYNLPPMLRYAAERPECNAVIAGAPSFIADDYKRYTQEFPSVRVLFGETYGILANARAAIVTSGTATLETALLGCPQVVVYRMWGGGFSNFVAKTLIKVPFISLVNLILGREAVEELFQSKFSQERLAELTDMLLAKTPYRTRMLADYEELRRLVGPAGCSRRAAELMVKHAK